VSIKERLQRQAGATLVEVLLAIALSGIMLPTLATALVTAHAGKATSIQKLQAQSLLREAQDAVRSVREKGWSNIATNGTYHPVISSGVWTLVSGSETISGLTRQIVISDTQRNTSGTIVSSGGTVDPSTKHVVVTVAWATPLNGSIASDSYLTRWQNNFAWTQTTQAEFDTRISANNTETTNVSGGEVQLSADGTPDWTKPQIVGSYNNAGTQNGLDAYTLGNYAYLSDGTVLSIYDKTDPTNPVLLGTYTASGTINQVAVSGNYAYLATSSTTAEVAVVNITNPAAPTLATNINLTGTAAALAVNVASNYLYVGRAFSTTTNSFEFQIIDITTPTAPVIKGGVDYTAQINAMKINSVTGNYAYLATSMTAQELTIVNITNKSSPTTAGTFNAPGTAIGNDLGLDVLNPTYVYLARANYTAGPEIVGVDVTNPAAPVQSSTYEVGGAVLAITALNGRVFLGTAITNKQFIALNVGAAGALTLLANFSTGGNTLNDVRADGNYVYCASASNTQELTVIGPTFSGNFAASGTFESATFDAGAVVDYNGVTFTITEPAGTNIQFQVATNNDNFTWNFVGPDGTAATYFTSGGNIPVNIASNRYIRYKGYFTGNGTTTPVLSDISINYSQ